MMRRQIAAIVFCVVGLGACTQIESLFLGGSVADTAPITMVVAEKGLTLTHLAYQGLGDVLIATANSGVLHGADAATAKAWYDAAGRALDAADKADDAANAQGVLTAVSAAQDAILKAKAVIPAK